MRTPPASKWRPLFVLRPNPLQGVFATTPAVGLGKKIGTANTCCALAVTVCGAARVMQAAGCAAGQRDARRDVAVMSLRRVRDASVMRTDAQQGIFLNIVVGMLSRSAPAGAVVIADAVRFGIAHRLQRH